MPDEEFADEVIELPVLIIGAGAAGVRVSIELAEAGIKPLVIGKREHGDAHTTWAAGGINAALGSLDDEDDWTIHAADTLKEGHLLNDSTAVELVAKTMPDRIRELDRWGMPFDRTADGAINQRYFGAQSYRRTCFVGDRTGEAILETLIEKAQTLGVPYRENVMITQLLSDENSVGGAVGYDMETGELLLFKSEHVVVAAGGYSALYNRHSSRDDENNGDGVMLALDAGATAKDLEFVQFHPTGMVGDRYGPFWDGRLVTEAVRGEGGRLFNAEGERFMERYSPRQMELDARDVVARAIAREIEEGRGTENGAVYLDITHRDPEYIHERLPRMVERFASLGVDITEEPMEVAPTAHYSMGGIEIDFRTGETGVDGLYAVGETVAGVHGANRLGGNSLAETVAIGKFVGDHLVNTISQPTTDPAISTTMRDQARDEFDRLRSLTNESGDKSPEWMLEEIGTIMQRHGEILRSDPELAAGIEKLDSLEEQIGALTVPSDRTSEPFEQAINAVTELRLAKLVLRAARRRTESRGAHFREDYTEKRQQWQKNILMDLDDGVHVRTDTPQAPGPAVKQALDADHELDYHHLE